MKILAVDTALGACSAALIQDGTVLARHCEIMERGHAEALAPMVEAVMGEGAMDFSGLDRLAVTTGPGTFTGQRVGLAFMRGLRLALKLPLVGVTTLAVMAEAAKAETGLRHAVALHDAKRDEVYVEIAEQLPPSVLSFAQAVAVLEALPGREPIALAGTAARRACEALSNRFRLSRVTQPDARFVGLLASRAAEPAGPPQPLYLRAPDARLPKAQP